MIKYSLHLDSFQKEELVCQLLKFAGIATTSLQWNSKWLATMSGLLEF